MKTESMEPRGVNTPLGSLSFLCLLLLGVLLLAFPARGANYEVTLTGSPDITVSPSDKEGQDTSMLDYSVTDGVKTEIVVYLSDSLDGFSYLKLYTTTSPLNCGSTTRDSDNPLSLSTDPQDFITGIPSGSGDCTVTDANLTYKTKLAGWSTSADTYSFTVHYEMQAV